MAENYVGVILQSPEEAEKNYAFTEIVASANPVKWVAKKAPKGLQLEMNDTIWRKFPIRDQDGSGSCVAQTMAKLMGILAYLNWGKFIVFSAGHIYTRRSNRNVGDGQGMVATDVYKIAQSGVTLEEFMPSMNMSESQMNALFENELHRAVNLKIANYIFLPVGDINAVASVIQTTKKGVMCWYRFGKGEWTGVPQLLVTNPPNHHSTANIDTTIEARENALVMDESWGSPEQRVIRESFYKLRNTHASYPMNFKFDGAQAPTPEKFRFTQVLEFVALDPQSQQVTAESLPQHNRQKFDVMKMQDILKKEGLLPLNIDSTGLYHNLTRKAVKAFQIKYAVASLAEIEELDGKRVGTKTLLKLNELYS